MGMAFTVIYTLVTDSVPKEMRGLVMGRGIRAYGFQAGFALTGAVMLFMLLLFNVLCIVGRGEKRLFQRSGIVNMRSKRIPLLSLLAAFVLQMR